MSKNETELKQMNDNIVNLTITDIPYGEVNREDNGLRNLNKENADYTIFTVDYTIPAKRKSAAKILIDECIYNRGQAIDINLTEDKAAIEIWLRNAENENLCYYFFPYDAAIIEV